MTPRQTNLTARLTNSLLTDHMAPDGFPKRPLSMKGQRWKHIVVEEKWRKKKVWLFLRKWRLFISEGGLKKRVGSHKLSQHVFWLYHCPKTFKNVLFVVQTTGQNFWCSPDYIIRITHGFRITYSGNIQLWSGPKGNFRLCVW